MEPASYRREGFDFKYSSLLYTGFHSESTPINCSVSSSFSCSISFSLSIHTIFIDEGNYMVSKSTTGFYFQALGVKGAGYGYSLVFSLISIPSKAYSIYLGFRGSFDYQRSELPWAYKHRCFFNLHRYSAKNLQCYVLYYVLINYFKVSVNFNGPLFY